MPQFWNDSKLGQVSCNRKHPQKVNSSVQNAIYKLNSSVYIFPTRHTTQWTHPMKRSTLSFIVAASLLGAAPAVAGGFSIDLPRITFPTPQPDASRDCQSPASVTTACTHGAS